MDSVRLHRLISLQSRSLSGKNWNWVLENFDNTEWDTQIYEIFCQRKFAHGLRITNIAVKATMNIQRELGLLLFPCAMKHTTPHKDAGAWSWSMPSYNGTPYGSPDHLSEIARRGIKLSLSRFETIYSERR